MSSNPSLASCHTFPYFPHNARLTAGHQGTVLEEDYNNGDVILRPSVHSLGYQVFGCGVGVHTEIFDVVHHNLYCLKQTKI